MAIFASAPGAGIVCASGVDCADPAGLRDASAWRNSLIADTDLVGHQHERPATRNFTDFIDRVGLWREIQKK